MPHASGTAWRARPLPPANLKWSAYGSSFLIGPIETVGRPLVDIRGRLVCLTGAPIVIYPLVRLGQRVRHDSGDDEDEEREQFEVSSVNRAAPSMVLAGSAPRLASATPGSWK